ncbi:MAG: tetratricopeptide repeat protein [Planctomycetes bacterium]|nr:tetratricopeptide repeat protein [Planctomycetota bacterium]
MKLLAALLLPTLLIPLAPLYANQVPDYLRPQTPQIKDDKDKPADDAPEPDDSEHPESWLAEGELALDVGRYKAARAQFKKVLKEQPENQLAARLLAQAGIAEGEYKDSLKVLERVLKAAGEKPDAATLALLGRTRLDLGDYTGAIEVSDQLFKLDKDDIDGVLVLGRAQYDTGLFDEAEKTFSRAREIALARRTTAWRIDTAKGRQSDIADLWCSAGECYFMLNKLHEANDCWGNALKADEYHLRSASWMSRLYLEQNHESSSLVNYIGPTLKHNAFAADLHFWAACVHFSRWRGGQGLKALEQCLKINPDHVQALPFRAQRLISTDDYDGGKRDYDKALKLNPRNIEALGAKGLHGKTLGLADVYNEAERAVLAFNAKPARFYEIIADGLSERFRYFEALPLYAKALECNPKQWTVYKGQGMAAMNKGDDVLGKKSLEIALDKDPLRNNLQTVNLLTLLDSYKNFDRIETEDGRWRLLVHKSEARVMKDMYIEQLQAAWTHLEKKYDFKPRIPLTIESFNVHADFEVRTVGITGLPALGACFGQLVTLDSPSARPAGSYNWASTLRHELDHVWQIQISNGQVPRWLAEGLSVYEEKTTRPEWERHMEDELFMRFHMDDIPPVKKFNEWFRDGSKILFAYYLGNVMLEFIDKKLGGMGAVRKMLEQFGAKRTPEQVFRDCLGIEPEVFDKQFRDYVANERIAHLRMVKRVSPDRIEQLFFDYEDGKATRENLVELALGYMQTGSRVDAELFLGMAQKKGAQDATGNEGALWNYTKAMLVRGDENLSAAERARQARQYIDVALNRGLEDYNTYLMMAGIARSEQNAEQMMHWLDEAQRAFPETAQPYAAKYQIYLGMEQRDKAIEAAEAWMRVDENNLDVRLWLIENVYQQTRNWTKMADMALQALYVAPLDARTHAFRAFALRKLKQYDEAVKHFEFVRRLAAGTPEEIKTAQANSWLDIASTWMQAEQNEKCKAALEEARKLTPDNPRIKTIERELNGEDEKEDGF